MGKYLKDKDKKKNPILTRVIPVVIVAVVLLLALVIAMYLDWDRIPSLNGEEGNPTAGEQAGTQPGFQIEAETEDPITVDENLRIRRMGSYAGIYMEDGTDERVSNVMMIILENTSEQDLQLARLDVSFADITAEFEVTNLPAGESVVLLEKNRQEMPDETYQDIHLRNVVFFQENMSALEDQFEITGGDGYLEVKNISEEDITGDIFVYYKNSAVDLLYGGITYRASHNGGLKAGETVRILTGHYSEGNSKIVHVTCG